MRNRSRRLRRLAPSTAEAYARILRRVYGDDEPDYVPDLDGDEPMPETVRMVLCAAVVDYWKRKGDEARGQELTSQIPEGPYVERTKIFPALDEISRFEAAVPRLPARVAAIVRVMLGLGFRTEEMLTLSRAQFEAAMSSDRIIVIGKGNKERELPTAKARRAISALLAAAPRDGRRWVTVGDLLGRPGSGFPSRRNMFARYVRRAALLAGLDGAGWSPHRLRHIFSTRMSEAGAPDAVVAQALGHSGGGVTRRYIHVSADVILRYMSEA